MLPCLIIDDEQAAIDLLVSFVEKVPFLTLVGTTTDPFKALEYLRSQPVKLVFLDVDMPYLSGLELINLIPDTSKVILTTAHGEYALQGFEHNALDYLLKPIPFERFLKAVQKAFHPASPAVPGPALDDLEEQFILVKTENKGKLLKINFSDILYVEGLKNYVSIYTQDERIVTLLNIKDLEERLPAKQFMRIHKSYIIALNAIKGLDGNQILLKNMKAFLPLGETYKINFFNALQKHIMHGKRCAGSV